MLSGLLAFVLFVAFVACDSSEAAPPPSTLPVRQLTVEAPGGASRTVTVEVASKPVERQQGLMYRQELAEDAGMLFLFPRPATGGFWMQNTYIPLTIAYLDADGTILVLRDGKPLDPTILTPDVQYHMVLEMNQGWFERHGFGPGSIVRVPGDLPEAR